MNSTEFKALANLSYYVWKTVRQAHTDHLTLGSICKYGRATKQKRDGEYVYKRIRT